MHDMAVCYSVMFPVVKETFLLHEIKKKTKPKQTISNIIKYSQSPLEKREYMENKSWHLNVKLLSKTCQHFNK